jgi:Tfp pilus assembly PilM family ATPase
MAMGLGAKKILALDWDRRHLRMVVVRPRADGVDLIKAVAVPMGSGVAMDDANSLGGFIRESLRQSKIGITRAVFCIPRDQVVLNSLNLPPTPESEMPALVQFQIAKELPFAADQAVLDFAVTGEYDLKTATTVLVTAIREGQLDFYKKVAAAAGLTIERVGLRPLANLIAIDAKQSDPGRKNILLVEVGPQHTEIDIIREGRMTFSRAASVALAGAESEIIQDSRIVGPAVRDREQSEADRASVTSLMKEVVLSFEAYRATEPAATIDTVIVAGASGLEPELATLLAGRFAAKTELFTPDKALNLTPERARELRGFSAVLGLALGYGRTGLQFIDFLHPKKPVSKRTIRMKKVPAAVLTAALLLASGYLFHQKNIAPLNKRVSDLQSANAKMKKDEKLIRDFENRLESLEGWKESSRHWPLSLAALTRIFPSEQEAYMTRLDVETKPLKKGYKFESDARLKFRTASLASGNELATQLREAAFLQVSIGKEIPGGDKGHYKYDTSIDLTLPDQKVESPSLASPQSHAAKDANPTTQSAGQVAVASQPSVNAPTSQSSKSVRKEPASAQPVPQPQRAVRGGPTTQPAQNGGRP